MEQREKKGLRMPTAYSILLLLILLVALLTHLIAGVRGASLAEVVMAIPEGFLDAIDVCLFILILGGFLGMVAKTGALDAGIAAVVRRFRGREMVLIPVLMLLFSLGGTTFGMAEETMAFYALITAAMVAAGFDTMVGAATVLVGAGVGVLGSTVNPFAVSAAIDALQSSGSGVSVDQGTVILLGAALWLTSLTVGILFVMAYARKVRSSGHSILTPAEREAARETYGERTPAGNLPPEPLSAEKSAPARLPGRQRFVLWIFGLSFLGMVVSLIPWESFGVTLFQNTAHLTGINLGQWYFQELQAWFLLSSILIAFAARIPEREAIGAFVAGAADMVGVVLVIAVSRGISVLMGTTGLDTYVLEHASRALGNVSPVLFAAGGYFIYVGLSFLIPSTSGLAAASMPTFGGLAAGLGLSPEVMIMIFCAASGVVNMVTPTSAVVMGGLSICRIEWPTWLRFAGKLLITLAALNLVMLAAAMALL